MREREDTVKELNHLRDYLYQAQDNIIAIQQLPEDIDQDEGSMAANR